MNWLFQKTGVINHYKPNIHNGCQPIRVLHHMNLLMFQRTHSSFSVEILNAFKNHGFSRTIDIIYEKEKVSTPCIVCSDKKIVLQETFLSYLWCVIYTLYTLYSEKIDFPRINKNFGKEIHKISKVNIDKAEKLFCYAKSLISYYSDWDIDNLPNPEKYLAENRNYIEQTNCIFTEAVKYILCHEFTHAIKHINEGECNNNISNEVEADYDAIELMKKSATLVMNLGIVCGILALFFMSPTTSSESHPDNHHRLIKAIEQMNIKDDNDCSYGIAIIGIELWNKQFNLRIKNNNLDTYKRTFYDLMKQIENMK